MRPANLLLILIVALLPAAAGAVDVDFGAIVDGVYDSNVYRTSSNQKQDGSFRFTPTIKIEVPGKKLSGNIRYAPTYEVFTTYSDANGLTHDVGSILNWNADEKTDVGLDLRFQALDVLNNGDPDTIDEGTTPIPDNDITRERIYLFGTVFQVTHAISPRWDSSTTINYDSFDSKRRLTTDSKSIGAFQNFDYGLTASDKIGGGAAFSGQFFDEVPGLPQSKTFVYQLFADYSHNFGERTFFSIRVGPALIHTIQDSFERTSTRATYPSIVIDGDTTVGELRSNQNLPIRDDDGQALTDATPVPDGSVVVPNSDRCLNDGGNPVLLEGSRCSFTRLFRNDGTIPNEQDPIDSISNDVSQVTLVGSNSGSNDLDWTIFGEVALTHFWLPTLSSTVSYNRRQSPARGQGASTVADSVLFRTNWQPTELWDVSLLASYVKRESPTGLSRSFLQVDGDDTLPTSFTVVRANGLKSVVEKSSAVDTHRFAVTLRTARRITRRISASFRFGYSDQRSQNTSRNPNDFGNILAVVGVKYDFDPFRF